MDYEQLLELGTTTNKQRDLVRAVDICHGSVTNAVHVLGWTGAMTNYQRMFRRIVAKAGLETPKQNPVAWAGKVQPKILFLDIETSLILAYSFGIRDQYIDYKQIANDRDGKLIHCVGLKWRGKRPWVLSEWEHGYSGMIKGVHEALCEADAVCTFNGAKFDLPKLEGQFQLEGLAPPPPPTQIDLYLAARKLGHISSKLDYLAPIMGLGGKVKHPGLEMWIDCFNEEPEAQKKMARYCAGDVKLTEQVYDALRPYIRNHPAMGETKADSCQSCGSYQTQHRGYRRTKASIIQLIQCVNCGSWSNGKRTAV